MTPPDRPDTPGHQPLLPDATILRDTPLRTGDMMRHATRSCITAV